MANSVLKRELKLGKRVRQIALLFAHPIEHQRCRAAVRQSRSAALRGTSFKYLGDYLALSFSPVQRREALVHHHSIMSNALTKQALDDVGSGSVLWRRDVPGQPPLLLTLEPSIVAPMEGELQLRFSFRTDLYALTFLLAPGELFGSPGRSVLFIGGLQGKFGARDEIREASKANGEIAASAMLLLGIQALGRLLGADELLAIGEPEQISMAYSDMIRFDYGAFWLEAGGKPHGRFYSLPLEPHHAPLSETPRSHRSRTRRKREEKQRITEQIEANLRELLQLAPSVGLAGNQTRAHEHTSQERVFVRPEFAVATRT